jgi:hypothetical protein
MIGWGQKGNRCQGRKMNSETDFLRERGQIVIDFDTQEESERVMGIIRG